MARLMIFRKPKDLIRHGALYELARMSKVFSDLIDFYDCAGSPISDQGLGVSPPDPLVPVIDSEGCGDCVSEGFAASSEVIIVKLFVSKPDDSNDCDHLNRAVLP